MSKTDDLAAIAQNLHDMKQLKLIYKYLYDKSERKDMFQIARKITRYSSVDVVESRNSINENNLYKNFLSSLEEFDSDFIYDYFVKCLKRITLVRNKSVEEDDAVLEYDIEKNKPTKFYLNLPATKLIITNQIGFAHEMGHIPEIDKPRKSYFEYSEALPIFFEYIAALDCYGSYDAKEKFINERLSMEINEASNIVKIYKLCDIKDRIKRTLNIQDYADNYKFLESLDYALQLIDIFEDDKRIVVDEIEKVINGKSLIEVSDDLEIDPSGCKRLLKEYKG